ncbi:MAG: tetratricopeptide repeat protein [Candidatus Krumholzibacteria bacterium]|nr:tetratricopeptide repeat protein [Candidatus Krumholzibacteria bacterium]
MSAGLRKILLMGLAAILLACWPALASLNTVSGLFQAGRYEDAREAVRAADEGARPGEEILWRSRLATDPKEAISLLESGLGDKKYPAAVRIRIALEVADIQAGRGKHREALDALTPLLEGDIADLPGAVHLRAGLSLRARGQLQKAREMLASVRPKDPEFVMARYYLGDIGLEQNDATLARRYFESGSKATDEAGATRLAAGMWRAYRTAGENQEAAELVADLRKRDPGSLALLDIRRLIQMENEELNARSELETENKVVTPVVDTTGRYALQLGAFSDRGLALEFVKRYARELPDLRIDKRLDQRGQFLYKVRTGDFVNPALARSEAKQLQRRLGIEVIVADLSAGGPQTGN